MWLVKFMLTVVVLFSVFLLSGFMAQIVFQLTHCLWTSSTVFSLFMFLLSARVWMGGGSDFWFT